MPKTVKVSRAPQAREKYVNKSVTRREKNPTPGVGHARRLLVHSSAMARAHQRLGFMSVRRPVGGRVGVRVRGHGVPWSAMHVVPAGPTPCARGCMLVCARPRVRWACLCECAARALARPKQKLVKVAPGYLRKRVKKLPPSGIGIKW